MRILISGATGFVGKSLVSEFRSRGHQVSSLVRRAEAADDEIHWDPSAQELQARRIEGFDAVINLAGENIARKRWSDGQKEKIRQSRIDSTRLLVQTLNKLKEPASVLLSASAVGFYGDPGQPVDESSPQGSGFLPTLCKEWEKEASQANLARIVFLRFGLILDPSGGLLETLLRPFRMGLGAKVGNGTQYMSWITLPDAINAIEHCLKTSLISGPVNITTPNPVINKEFTRALGESVHRPAFFTAPASLLRILLGELADALLLADIRALPRKLQNTGFVYAHPTLSEALAKLLSNISTPRTKGLNPKRTAFYR